MKEKIVEIINTLIVSTKSGNIKWDDVSDINKRSYERNMKATGEDGTIFEIVIRYSLISGNWVKESKPSIWITNKDLPGGKYFVYDYKECIVLRDLIQDMYCSDMNPKIDEVESIFDNINKGISLSTYRDNKLSNLLGNLLGK